MILFLFQNEVTTQRLSELKKGLLTGLVNAGKKQTKCTCM